MLIIDHAIYMYSQRRSNCKICSSARSHSRARALASVSASFVSQSPREVQLPALFIKNQKKFTGTGIKMAERSGIKLFMGKLGLDRSNH